MSCISGNTNNNKDATPKSSPVTPTKDFDILKIPIPTEIISGMWVVKKFAVLVLFHHDSRKLRLC